MCDRFKKLDIFFNQDIKLTYEKSVFVRSVSGAVSSILIILGVLAYVINGLTYVRI